VLKSLSLNLNCVHSSKLCHDLLCRLEGPIFILSFGRFCFLLANLREIFGQTVVFCGQEPSLFPISSLMCLLLLLPVAQKPYLWLIIAATATRLHQRLGSVQPLQLWTLPALLHQLCNLGPPKILQYFARLQAQDCWPGLIHFFQCALA